MNKASTIFLRLAIIGYGFLVVLFSIFLLPNVFAEAATELQPIVYVTAAIGIYGAALPFFFALFQGLRLLHLIDMNKTFSKRSVGALAKIKVSAVLASILFAISLPLFYSIAQLEDAPGLVIIGMAITGAPFVVGVFAGLMQRLLQNAVDIKSENDLTV